MRHKRIKNLIVGGALIGALFVSKASAYDAVNTHPALTNEIVNFYNLNFPQKLSDQDKSWIIQGSTDEDQGIRALNHFYDPIHNIGMAGFPTSKQWAMSSGAQSNFFAISSNLNIAEASGVIKSKSPDDFSYPRVIADYAQGDRQRAMIGFGHLLHLLEDAGVPDHTRNDPHPPVGTLGSPYEHEMAKWNPENFNIAPELKKEGLKPVILANLGEYFDKLARYSNGNFFSKDTISNDSFNLPSVKVTKYLNINGKTKLFIVGKDQNGKEFPLAFVRVENIDGNPEIKSISLTSSEIGSFILDGYWDRLSKEVVLNGAGALNLLITEAEKAKQEFANKPPEKNWFARLLGLMGIDLLTTSDGIATSDVKNSGVDNSNIGDNLVTPTPKVTNQQVSPSTLVTKTPVTNVTILSPTPSPSKTPVPTQKPSATPLPQATPKLSTAEKSGRIVINEIAWAGTDASTTDEWLELYNTESNLIDISGWRLVSDDKSPDITLPPGNIIPAGGYFLIERTNDSVISDLAADLAVSFGSGGLNNEGEVLKLIDASGIISDVVGKTGEKWFAGNSTDKISMERISADQAGDNASNWKNFTGSPVNHDAFNNLINGTPKAKNSVLAVVVTTSGGGSYGGGGGGGTSSIPSPTPSPSPSPSMSPTPTPSPTPDPSSPLLDVVINEIAWMGTATSSNDEWMELYNTTNQTVDLTGWTLKANNWTSNITLSGDIKPYGFYVLERGPNHVFSDVTADKTYSGGLSLDNSGGSLILKNSSGTLQDSVDGSSAWLGKGTASPDYKSMERIDPRKSGNDATNWATNNGIIKNGHDAANNPINGTPKATNSSYVALKPSAIDNLVATINSPLKITWSAPEDLDTLPTSLSYDLRYATKSFATLDDWNTALKVASASLPSVGEKGASQSASFDIAYSYDQKWYFAMKTVNKNNPSDISDTSNITDATTKSALSDSWSMLGANPYHTSFASNLTGPGAGATISWGFEVGSAPSLLANVFRSNGLNASCPNGGDNIRLFDYLHNSLGAYPCSGQYFNTWGSNFNSSFNDTTFTEFEQVGTLPCGTYDECKNAKTTLAVRQVVLRADGWTAPPTGSINNAVVSADGDIYFGASDGSSNKLFKLDKNGAKQWEYASNVSIGMPAVLSDGTVYFGRIGAGGVLAFMALNPDGSKKWDFNDASTVKAVTVSSKGEPYFTYQSGAQDKLAVLKPDGSVKTLISGTGLSNFSPVVLENGNIITASYVSGNQFFTAYSSAGLQLWNLAYTGVNGNIPSNPSYEKTTGKTYSAAGSKLFDIPSGGAVLNAHQIDLLGTAATMVAISSDTLYVGFNDINPASGSRLFAINKSDLTIKWAMPFSANSRMNGQLAVDKDDNIYFSTEGGSVYAIDKLGSQKWKIDTGMASVISPVLTENGIIWGYGNRLVEIK